MWLSECLLPTRELLALGLTIEVNPGLIDEPTGGILLKAPPISVGLACGAEMFGKVQQSRTVEHQTAVGGS
jgi:hypothetical protein